MYCNLWARRKHKNKKTHRARIITAAQTLSKFIERKFICLLHHIMLAPRVSSIFINFFSSSLQRDLKSYFFPQRKKTTDSIRNLLHFYFINIIHIHRLVSRWVKNKIIGFRIKIAQTISLITRWTYILSLPGMQQK